MLPHLEQVTINDYIHVLAATFIILNPINNIPIFLAFTEDVSKKMKTKMLFQTALTVFITLSIAVWTGETILELFQIKLAAFKVGGGLLLGYLGFQMVFSDVGKVIFEHISNKKDKSNTTNVAVVPLGIPILAGPGAIATVIIFAHLHPGFIDNVYTNLMVLIVCILVMLVLATGIYIRKLIGDSGLNILSRIMGLFQLAIGANMLITGIIAFIPGLQQ